MRNNNVLSLPLIARAKRRVEKNERSSTNSRIRLKFLWPAGFSSIIFLIVFCVFQLNAYTKSYYFIQNAQNQLSQLTEENRNLEISFSNTNSLNNIDEHIKNFEAITKIEYIRILEGTVLAK